MQKKTNSNVEKDEAITLSVTVVQPKSAAEAMRLIGTIVVALVDDPSQVSVSLDMQLPGRPTIVRVRTAAGDIGKVIGKQGRTARAIRTILSAYSQREKTQITLDIVEGDKPCL